jgi:inhibitor of cysteine peptidase
MIKNILFSSILFSAIAYASVEKRSYEKGDTFTIELPANWTTGYRWYAQPLAVKSIVGISKSEYIPKKSGLIGSGGTQVFTLRARRQGTITIVFEYKRSWEKDTPPVETREFIIEVK